MDQRAHAHQHLPQRRQAFSCRIAAQPREFGTVFQAFQALLQFGKCRFDIFGGRIRRGHGIHDATPEKRCSIAASQVFTRDLSNILIGRDVSPSLAWAKLARLFSTVAAAYPRSYLGVEHTSDLVIVQITFNDGRTTAQKKALYKAIAEGISTAASVRLQDVFVNLIEVKKENWSFGNGLAQYAEP